MKTTLFKKDCDPYIVTSKESLEFHLNQGWVENEEDLTRDAPVIPPTKPYNVLDTPQAPVPDATNAEIQSLTEALAAKDQVIAGLNESISKLKGDEVPDTGFGLPLAPAPAPAPAPKDPSDTWIQPSEGPTNQQLRDQLDAAGIKHTPRDNKASLLALVASIPAKE